MQGYPELDSGLALRNFWADLKEPVSKKSKITTKTGKGLNSKNKSNFF